MKWFRFVACSLLWPVLYAFSAVLVIAGWVIVPVLAWRRAWDPVAPRWEPRWARLWGEDESGIFGPQSSNSANNQRWCERAKNWSLAHRAISWCAIRNPVANERFTRLGIYLDRAKMEWAGNSENPWESWKRERRRWWCIARQGWRAGVWIVLKSGMTLRFGSPVYPGYVREIDRYRGLVTLQRRPN